MEVEFVLLKTSQNVRKKDRKMASTTISKEITSQNIKSTFKITFNVEF